MTLGSRDAQKQSETAWWPPKSLVAPEKLGASEHICHIL